MTHTNAFPDLVDLFNGKAKNDLQSYQLVYALILDIHRAIDDDIHRAIARDLTSCIYKFKSIKLLLEDPHWVNSEQFLLRYTECLTRGATIDLTAEPFRFRNLPPDLAGPCILEPLAGANTACIRPHSATNFSPEQRRFILLWYNNHPQRSDVSLYILDLEEQSLHALSTYGFWIYQDLLIIFLLLLDLPLWTDPVARANHFRTLPKAEHLAHMPASCPIHFGHYLQNNLAHLSRLEDLHILNSIEIIFRPKTFDYFTYDEEKLFFTEATRGKFRPVENEKEAVQFSMANKHALIVSKSSSYGTGLSTNFCNSVRPESDDTESAIRVCVGVRGGTRMCLNLVDFAVTLATELRKITGRPVHLLVDGMSKSALNSSDTTASLSTSFEQEIADEIIAKASVSENVSASSIVGLTTFQQLSQIRTCSLALSGYGTQYDKYMYLCNVPTIVHGVTEPDTSRNINFHPNHLYLGKDSVENVELTHDKQRNNYKLNIGLSTAKSVVFAHQSGRLTTTKVQS